MENWLKGCYYSPFWNLSVQKGCFQHTALVLESIWLLTLLLVTPHSEGNTSFSYCTLRHFFYFQFHHSVSTIKMVLIKHKISKEFGKWTNRNSQVTGNVCVYVIGKPSDITNRAIFAQVMEMSPPQSRFSQGSFCWTLHYLCPFPGHFFVVIATAATQTCCKCDLKGKWVLSRCFGWLMVTSPEFLILPYTCLVSSWEKEELIHCQPSFLEITPYFHVRTDTQSM